MSKFNPYPVWKCCGVDQSPLFTTCKICRSKNKDLKLVGHDWECPKCHMIMFQDRECQSRTCKEQRLKSHEQLTMTTNKLIGEVASLKDSLDTMMKLINDNKINYEYQIKQLKTIVNYQEDQILKLKSQINKINQPDTVSTFVGFGSSTFYTDSSDKEITESQITSLWNKSKYSGTTWTDESYEYTAQNGY
jgi:hypothetical protein